MLPGAPELAIILVIVLIVFGAGKLPQVFEAFGKGLKNFRDAQRDDEPPTGATGNAPGRQLGSKDGSPPVIREAEEVRAE